MTMKPKLQLLIGAGVLAAFVGGTLLGRYSKPAVSDAMTPTPIVSSTTQQRAAPAPTQRYVEYAPVQEERPVVRRHHRSWERQALIVLGSSGAGAGIGALAGGGKGAGIGALSGGVAGMVYNLATRNR